MTVEEARAARIQKIGERANRLMKTGYYAKEDVLMVRDMTKRGVGLVDIEAILYLAERDVEEAKTTVPTVREGA